MKLQPSTPYRRAAIVVPLAGTWIETLLSQTAQLIVLVVPLAGTWIETCRWEIIGNWITVVPLAGTWIETFTDVYDAVIDSRRSPCGNVD